jgi:hypothetical protein
MDAVQRGLKMKINLKQAKILRETAARLIKQAEELEAGIDRRKCKDGTYTDEPFNTHGCKTCGNPKVVICNHPKVIGKRRNSKGCNSASCKYFQSVASNSLNIEH